MTDLFIGTQTIDLPTITVGGITGASINVGGIVIRSERGKATPSVISDPVTFLEKYGKYKAAFYGHYVVRNALKNLQGEPGIFYVSRVTGTGAATAKAAFNNSNADPVWNIHAGQKGGKDPGKWGEQLLISVKASSRGESTLTAATASTDTILKLTSVAPYMIGDFVNVAGASSYTGKVVSIDEVKNEIKLDTPATGVNASGQIVSIVDRTIVVRFKDADTGNVEDKETWSNLSTDSTHPRYWAKLINDPDLGSSYIFAEQLVTADIDTFADLPATTDGTITTSTAMTGGADGATPTASEYAAAYQLFNDLPINYLTNAESFTEAAYDDGELYCSTRKDCIWIGAPLPTLTYAESIVWANKRRKSKIIYALNNRQWFYTDDPIGVGASPVKLVPNVGAVMGFAIYITSLRGIHKVPASPTQTLVDIRSLYDEITDRQKIRNLANLGLNTMSNVDGSFSIRSARTPSTLPERAFVNATAMSIYFKKTYADALRDLENEPNTVALLDRIKEKIRTFAYAFYQGSSNGGSEGGFASYRKPNGALSTFDDVVIITTDGINPLQKINDGELHVNFSFAAPGPAEAIQIGVGLIFNK